MRCPRCREENPPQAKFCMACGGRLALACAACATELPPEARFCYQCGRAVGEPPADRFRSPQTYTPAHLAEKILTSRTGLEGERKQVTVLFADLKGSMELLADRDPEDARKILDPVLERMMDAVHHYEGTVNQVMGDGIMALFGAPVAHEDHAVRACYAALRMQESVTAYGDDLQRTHGVPAQIRVGLNSGEVVVRAIGGDLHMDYTAVGQTTHLAARMEQMAKPGTVLATAGTLRLAEGWVQVRSLGPTTVKGLDAPVDVFEVVGIGTARSRLQVAAARGLTRFVGRRVELDVLVQALERARAGQGQLVALAGEAGVGKSRLFWEFVHSHHTRDWLVLESRSMSYGRATPYAPVIELLRAYFGIEPRDDGRKIREKTTGKLLTLDRALEALLPAFLALLDPVFEDPEWQGLEPAERRQRLLDAVRRLFFRESQVKPVLIIVEDVHWLDTETQAILDGAIERLGTTRVLLMVNFRPEYHHGWAGRPNLTQLRLDPLRAESADELLGALLGEDPRLGPLKRLLIDRTGGNPFFLEESVRTLAETGALAGSRGAYRLVKGLPSIRVPPTVQAILAARIDRLPPDEKHLLQAAAVVGRDVPFPLLRAVADTEERALRRNLAHLETAELIYAIGLGAELEYMFPHALTHEVAYHSLLHEHRRALHARLVDAIERLHADRLTEHVERLAHHAFRGEVWPKAVTYLWQAGAKAASRSAHREAVVCLERAIAALGRLPESRQSLERAVDLRVELRHSLMSLGQHAPIREHLERAEAIAEALGDRRRQATVASFMANYAYLIGDADRATDAAGRALALAKALDDPMGQLTANFYLSQAYQALGNYRDSLRCARENIAALEAIPRHQRVGRIARQLVVSQQWAVLSMMELGEFDEAVRKGEENLREAETTNRPEMIIGAAYGLALVHMRRGDAERAVPILERSLELSRTVDIPVVGPLLDAHLGYAYALAGETAPGIEFLERAIEGAEAMGLMADQGVRRTWLGEAYLLAGRLEDARAQAERALTITRERKERGHEAWAELLRGDVAGNVDPPDLDEAERAYRRALAIAQELGMRPVAARCHLGLGALLRAAERIDEAEHHHGAARTLVEATGMRL